MRAPVVLVLALALAGCTSEASKQRHYDDGRRFMAANRPREAIVAFRNAVDLDDTWGDARFHLAEAYAAAGQPERAYHEYIRAADLLPDRFDAQLKAASFLLLARQFEDARTRATRALEIDPKSSDAQILIANALAGARDLDGAIARILEAIAVDPGHSQSYMSLARLQVAKGQHDAAVEAYAQALRLAPNSVPAHLALANYQWSIGEHAAAEQTLLKAYKLDPANVMANRTLSAFYLSTERSDDAERHLKFLAETSKLADDRLALADFYLTHDRLDQARAILEPMATRVSTQSAAETRLARLDYLRGDTAAAADRLDRVLTRDPNYASALVLRAERLLRDKSWEEALWSANAAIAANPRLAPPYYLRAEAELETHRLGDAMKSYTEILRMDPEAVDAKIALSRLHLARNEVDTAVLYAEEAVRNAPDSVDGHLALIRAWLVRGDEGLASTELQRLLKSGAADAELWVLTGQLSARRGDARSARDAFARALKADPTSREALSALTAMDLQARDLNAARQRLDAALKHETDGDLLTLAGRVALAAGDLSAAEGLLRRAIAGEAAPIAGFALLARVFQQQQRLDAAVQEFDRLAQRETTTQHARLMAAVAVHTAGNIAEAERRYEEILKRDPRSGLAANNLAAIFIEQGQNYGYAEKLAGIALEQLPAEAEVADTVGSLHYRRANYRIAIRFFQQAVALEPTNPLFHYRLGQAYVANVEPERARAAFQSALRLNSGFGEARTALSALEH